MFRVRRSAVAVALATFVVATGAVSSSRALDDADVSFTGPVEVGGALRVILSGDRTAVLGFETHDVPFGPEGGCGLAARSMAVYFDPPGRVEGKAFQVSTGDLGTVHNPYGVTLHGTVISPSEITGTVQQTGGLGCGTSPEYHVDLADPVERPTVPENEVFRGRLVGGAISLTLDDSGQAITTLRFADVSIRPCIGPDNPLDVNAWFDPSFPLDSATPGFRAALVVVEGKRSVPVRLSVRIIRHDNRTIAGVVDVGQFSSSCGPERGWRVTLGEATPHSIPTVVGPTPAALPESGSGGGSTGRSLTDLAGLVTAVLLGLAVLSLGTAERNRR